MAQEKINEELMDAVHALVKIKKVPESVVFEALEMVLLTAYKKEHGNAVKASIDMDHTTGKYHIYADKVVVSEIDPDDEEGINKITVKDAKLLNPAYEEGDYIRIDVTPKDFGRTAAQTAKQVMIQKLREAERGSIYAEFSGREGDIITGTVKSSESRTIFVDLGRVEGILPYNEQIAGETFEPNQKIKCYVLEVPEIYSGTVEIKSVVREAGSRSKIAVYAMDPTIDPVGACVGPKGQRVQDIVNELHDEKIDIVRWDEDPAVYIANALSPAKVISVSVWEDDKSSYVIVPDYQLSLAIGKSGQNARLAAKLTGWKIDIKSESQAVQEGVLTPEGESEGAFDDTDDILGDIEAEGNTEDNE